ncbi:MAG: hypothetical protein IJJ43_04730 [Oscillospiraceae bacterium]|nr:hypothetical protein [Oscillospiraceae bacterium]
MDPLYSAPYIEENKLSSFGEAAAKLLRPESETSGRRALSALRRDLRALRQCREAVQKRYGEAASPPAACAWLLDNWYLVQQESLAVREAFSGARRLRLTGDELLLLALCRSLLHAGHGEVTAARCRLYLEGFQRVTPLRRRELRLFPAALRAAVLEALAEVCRRLPYAADTDEHAKAFEALFGTLRLLAVTDLERLLDEADVSGAVLASERAGVYSRMDRGTRQQYLERLEHLARRAGVEEYLCARRLVRRADAEEKHVGFLLFPPEDGRGAGAYIAANVLLTAFLSLLPGFLTGCAAAVPLLLLPVSELVKRSLDALLLRFVPPRRLPRMDPERGVPPEGKTVCVLAALLTDERDGEALCARLEQFRLAQRGAGDKLFFGLLADLPAADSPETERDEALLRGARTAVRRLNRRYGGGFYLFTRPREFDGERYSAPERKRGALLELAALVCDESSKLRVEGERDALIGARCLLTLDSDTLPYPGSLTELIAAMLHPLNAPRLDEARGLVTAGHAVIHPRIGTQLRSASATDFALLFAGPGGSDPYGALCGELYMNVFGSGGFAGKGILDARALLACSRRFPAQRILSHDALEGAFLRGAFMGDAEFSDSFPARPLSYYKRLHRWVRGDWQNAPWLFRRGRGLPAIERWRLFDSLRRSLLPPLTLLALTAGFFLPGAGLSLAALAALASLLSRLLPALLGALLRGGGFSLRRFTRLLGGLGGAIVQSFVQLWLLPYEAWVCLTAAATALWRLLVSRKKLLEWETAAQSELRGEGGAVYLRAMWPAMLLGLACLLFSPAVIGKSAGLFWLLSPLAAAALALPAQSGAALSRADREYLRQRAGEIWRYFADFSTAREHFLPPDNVQEQPPLGPASRVSPTNAGLAAASAVAACDLELILPGEALGYLKRLTDTLERLPRCLGHFYNWYDTRTLLPLHPAMISTVDSGNLCAGLTVAARFADEQGDAALAARLEALVGAMDFSPLFDRSRGLFHICYDPVKGCGTGGWYDLLASEARLTSYFAVARGDVPLLHWRRLSRAQLQKDGYRGLASWSGSMFEYLMPELFLPLERGSLLDESCRFCLYAQLRQVSPGQPWGVSESAFFSLDSRLNYRYKAHGCPALALRREREAELVVSPYSSFLALSVRPAEAVKNLRRLERFGALGRCGFFEAVDFTQGRCRSERGEVVRCVMAHHAGMSLLAAANLLCEDSIRRRFLAVPAMAAFEALLQERLPEDGAVVSRRSVPPRDKPLRREAARWSQRGGPDERGCVLLSNGAYSLFLDERGSSRAALGDHLIYRESPVLTLNARTLLPAACSFWELGEDAAVYQADRGGLACRATLCAGAGDSGELRRLQLAAEESTSAAVELSFEPLLAREADFRSHPAFWRLGLWSEIRGGALLLRRLPRGETPELWLCLACSRPARFSADRNGALGWLSQPLVRARAELSLAAGEAAELSFALCAAPDAEAALAGARRLLTAGENERGSMLSAAATLLGLSAGEIGAAMALLPALREPKLHEAAPRRALWPYALSGELPILCCEADAAESEALLGRWLLLKTLGQEADLVYLSGELGEYRQPLRDRILRPLEKHGLEALLGVSGGVHFAPREAAGAIRSRAAWEPGRTREARPTLPCPVLGAPRRTGDSPSWRFTGRAFSFEAGGRLPAKPWQLPLTNGRLSYLAADCGSGELWLENAREMPLDPPPAQPEDVTGGEQLWVETAQGPVSLFAANDGRPCRVSFSPGLAVWEKELDGRRVKTSAYIPRDVDARVLLIEGAEGLRLCWSMALRLSPHDGSALRCTLSGELLRAENPESYWPGAVFLAGSSGRCLLQSDLTPPGFLLRTTAEHLSVLVCGCCGEEALRRLCRPDAALAELGATVRGWASFTDRLELTSAHPALDRYLNGWAAYQTLACRLLARGSLYQRGGAYGFRDQLQDAVNLLPLDPSLAREQIERCCRHQYVEGDVMHWWHPHPEGDRGLRTRCSDDLLWLSWALCEYYEATGDADFCLRELPYLGSPPLREDERDRYETAAPCQAAASALDHARAALERCVSRGFGAHGLPLMGSGDWNDGLDAVGGESVWLGWFFSDCALRFAALLEALGKPGSERFREFAGAVGRAAEASFLPQGWYARGYWPDGELLGGAERIDSLAQSWAAFSPFAAPEHAAAALDAALARLVDREHGLVRLFDPPYGPDERRPGYLASYGEGFRENGGQYTHGAVWLAMACFRLGRAETGLELLELLLPEKKDPRRYGAEPFVLAADVSAAPGHEGEAGWSWYTGSAGWFLRAAAQELLGLRLCGGELRFEPKAPPSLGLKRLRWTDPEGKRHELFP